MSFKRYPSYQNCSVEWLDQMPDHWDLTAIKHLCRKVTDGSHISPETENGLFCFVSTKDIRNGKIDFDGCLRTSEESYSYMVRSGCRPMVGEGVAPILDKSSKI
jgi:type I restriction enzyme, S subunit